MKLKAITDMALKAALRSGTHWGRAVTWLGPLPAATVKGAIRPIGRLDYDKSVIKMAIDGPGQLTRLGACKKEPETVAWLERSFRPGDVLYDVGANMGAYSFVASAVAGGNCTVYAFEPSFSTFAGLAANVFLNECQNHVTPLQLALGARTGMSVLHYTSLAAGAASHRVGAEAGGPADGGPAQPILAYRLDELIETFGLRPPTHLKIDVDGTEAQVVEGAVRTLRSGTVRSVLIEVDEPATAGQAVFRFMRDQGYAVVSEHPRGTSGLLANVIFEPQSSR